MAFRILIVDDDPFTLFALAAVLQQQFPDCLVETTQFGQHALYLIATGTFHLLLADVRMPGTGGLQLLREIKRRAFHVPVFLMTGYDDHELRAEAVRLGAVTLLQKPLHMEDLSRLVAEGFRGGQEPGGRSEGRRVRLGRRRGDDET